MISKFKSFLDKNSSSKESQPSTPKSKNTLKEIQETQKSKASQVSRCPRYPEQLQRFTGLYQKFSANAFDESTSNQLETILDHLQEHKIQQKFSKCYSPEQLSEFLTQAKEDYTRLGTLAKERVKSFFELSDEEMQKAVSEAILLCDQNPENAEPLELVVERVFNKDSSQSLVTQKYEVFPKNALSGLTGHQRFIPPEKFNDSAEGFSVEGFLKEEHPQLGAKFGSGSQNKIVAITTIGSLGGIGHKPDSDADLQAVFNTSLVWDYQWNDADYFLAFLECLMQDVVSEFLHRTLSLAKSTDLLEQTKTELQDKCREALTADEVRIVDSIFPCMFQEMIESKCWNLIRVAKPAWQSQLLWTVLKQKVVSCPWIVPYIKHLLSCFPMLSKVTKEQLMAECFPFILQKTGNIRCYQILVKFYQKWLGNVMVSQILNTEDGADPKKSIQILMAHLRKNPLRHHVLKNFAFDLASKLSPEMLPSLLSHVQSFAKSLSLEDSFLRSISKASLEPVARQGELQAMVKVIEAYQTYQAMRKEAESELSLHQKILNIENYLTHKYPDTETHVFTNILRKQRAGEHTPFLVSPEGSMAYGLMLNDSLLNCAMFLGGLSPMPFSLPKELKALLKTGVLLDQWTLQQEQESFPVQSLPDWGQTVLEREQVWEHVIPIYLRESEKVSHRNLPKALLNCWWLEMIVCHEKDEDPVTSLTQLLLYPEQRQFIKLNDLNPYSEKILKLEDEFPQLVKDPWWIKYTEMLTRFQDAEVKEQIVFCFTQHIRLTDVINFHDGSAIWIEKGKVSWRTACLVRFYELFVSSDEQRETLMNFAQGRDSTANQIESILKKLFLKSLRAVEQKLQSINNERALHEIQNCICTENNLKALPPDIFEFIRQCLTQINTSVMLADPKILKKAKQGQTLSPFEKIQLNDIQLARSNFKKSFAPVIEDLKENQLSTSLEVLEECVMRSRIRVAGDPLENVIFRYHFERNFKRKKFQIPLPISKSLSIPRSKVMLVFNEKKRKWTFKSVIGRDKTSTRRTESVFQMFEAPLTEGVAKCVFSGYLGYTSRNLTAFEKPAVFGNCPELKNSINHQDIQNLAFSLKDFFVPRKTNSQELLENIHYVSDIFMVCGVDHAHSVSLIVRDNFGDNFAHSFGLDMSSLKKPKDSYAAEAKFFFRFFSALNMIQARQMFATVIEEMNLEINPAYPPRFGVWVNDGNFEISVSQKLKHVYLAGVASAMWNAAMLANDQYLEPIKIANHHALDKFGKLAIEKAVHTKK